MNVSNAMRNIPKDIKSLKKMQSYKGTPLYGCISYKYSLPCLFKLAVVQLCVEPI